MLQARIISTLFRAFQYYLLFTFRQLGPDSSSIFALLKLCLRNQFAVIVINRNTSLVIISGTLSTLCVDIIVFALCSHKPVAGCFLC